MPPPRARRRAGGHRAVAGGSGASAAKFKTLYSFCAQGGTNCTDGKAPVQLIMDAWGPAPGANPPEVAADTARN